MRHQPFEEWLLNDQKLTDEQERALRTHLQTCSSCAILAEVNLALHNTKTAAAAAGFADRFQIRLAARRKAQARRRSWGILTLTLVGLGTLAWLAWPIISAIVQSPADLLTSWASSLASLWFFLRTVGEAVSVFFEVLFSVVPPYVWLLALSVFCGISFLWAASIRKYSRTPQGV